MTRPNRDHLSAETLHQRMPKGYKNDLMAMIWSVGQCLYSDILDDLKTPGHFIGRYHYIGKLSVNTEFILEYVPETDSLQPKTYAALVAETEPHSTKKGVTVFDWKMFSVELKGKGGSVGYNKGISFIFEQGDELEISDRPQIAGAKPPRMTQAGAMLQEVTNKFYFQDYKNFMDKLRFIKRELHTQ